MKGLQILILILPFLFLSCGKTKLDNSSSAHSSQSIFTCAQLPDCAKNCGGAVVSSTNPRSTPVYDSSTDPCMTKSVQVINGVIVNVAK